jgi:hypothetical protein
MVFDKHERPVFCPVSSKNVKIRRSRFRLVNKITTVWYGFYLGIWTSSAVLIFEHDDLYFRSYEDLSYW